LVLFCGFLMTMLLVGIATGWPLMIAAISTEDSDGFDGLSRGFGYLIDRPWNAGLLAIVSLSIFAVSRFVVAILIGLTISLGANAISRGYGTELVESSPSVFNASVSVAASLEATLTNRVAFAWPDSIAGIAIVVWIGIPAVMLAGFGPSFFWSATTVTYFLLRHSDDGTPLDAVTDWPLKSSLTADAAETPIGNSPGEADSSSPPASLDAP
ncbi:MAG: hypothetical protein O3B86_13775, partial [Planctomycetota bacterium]|nr:hypothetical protein [Planctomycetota bacterium]